VSQVQILLGEPEFSRPGNAWSFFVRKAVLLFSHCQQIFIHRFEADDFLDNLAI
jgi:hypothetical protein